MNLRRTKIVSTLGPATDPDSVLLEVLREVDAVRLNFSHGNIEDHIRRIESVRRLSIDLGKDVAVFADLQGPKIRIGCFEGGECFLNVGDRFIFDLDCDPNRGSSERVWFDYPGLVKDVQSRENLIFLLDDGKIRMRVCSSWDRGFECIVECGGVLFSRKGMSVLGGGVCAPMLTSKDLEDLKKACQLDVDMIALSFPASGNDILKARELIDAYDPTIGIISKIERKEAVDNLEDIIQYSDVVMVARGDLALEVGEEEVPILQKYIIKQGRLKETPIIVATQMMESMTQSATPTRAEVSDVANAVLDGADCVMLSAETATGLYPSQVVQKVASICKSIEKHSLTQKSQYQDKIKYHSIDESVAYATMYLANRMPVSAIIALTEHGKTPRIMSRVRTGIPIYALSRKSRSRAFMSFLRDVYPVSFDMQEIKTSKQLVVKVVDYFLERGVIGKEDCFILTHGDDLTGSRSTSTLKVCKVADILSYGSSNDCTKGRMEELIGVEYNE
ncbi:MAG: pyruvate kinase [Pseudomonadota bacterium]|nr:pyruvate kinase [Pseudomonadota bacterium]